MVVKNLQFFLFQFLRDLLFEEKKISLSLIYVWTMFASYKV